MYEALRSRRPFSAVPFTGQPIFGIQQRHVTDWHVVDARGRTVRVYPYTMGRDVSLRKQKAERHARRLNGTLGALGSWRGGHRWYCRLCGAQIVGPGRV